jgi:hypothetical protein
VSATVTLEPWGSGDLPVLEAYEFEFPKGHFMTCNDWRLDLRAYLVS